MKMKYAVIKTFPGSPGNGSEYATRSRPEGDVVLSRHGSRELADKALRAARRNHSGLAPERFRVELIVY
jgi:hypothetical protein